ncbi:Zinc transporter 6 [Taenia crassiceps]|uniref:Zinc transporter 6 n=1 Tax=Taenia crassiceps TaxID=6207 RepID=A0ABR4QTG5_9CEST
MLQTVNELSTHRLDSLVSQLRANTRLLVSMKRELVAILKRTDSVRKTLMNQYPPAYELASGAIESAWKAELETESTAASGLQPLTQTQTMVPLNEFEAGKSNFEACLLHFLGTNRSESSGLPRIALSAFSDLILFDVLFLLVALVSIWVRQQMADEAVERLFEPVVVGAEYMPWAALLCLGLHMTSIYSIDNPAFTHVTQACVSSWLQEQVSDISRSLRSLAPVLSRALPPRMNPIALVGSMVVVVILVTYFTVDPTTETGTFPDTVAAVVISFLLFNTMVPMAVFSGKILLQTTPSYLVTALDKALREASTLEGVLELRNEHFWTIGFGVLVGSLYVRVRRDASDQLVLAHVTKRLHPFVKHLTIQVIKDDWVRPAADSNFDWSQHQLAACTNEFPFFYFCCFHLHFSIHTS